MKRYNKLFLAFLTVLFISSIIVFAEQARDITDSITISCNGLSAGNICDNNLQTHSSGTDVTISITSSESMGGIYIKYYKIPNSGLLDETTPIAQNGFLHEFINLDGKTQATLSYSQVDISDIYVYSVGDIPKDVQIWQVGDPQTDILLCATHSDDDQLFFAGLLPYYAGHIGANVRVAYFINHYDTYNRTHELLDGLWHCGVTNYPDISPFPDGYSESVDGAINFLSSRGVSYDDVLFFQKSLIDKYKPLVVVLHDFNGEYGHGAHMLNTKSFIEVCNNASGDEYVPEKIYVHLYGEDSISLDIDRPLDEFGGQSAFNVSQEAFGYHKSQHWTWFYGWIYGKGQNITKSAEIKTYNPASYGLYYSRIGEDIAKNDILENVILYSERNKVSEEETEAIEKEIISESEKSQTIVIDSDKTKDERQNVFLSPFVFLPPIVLIIAVLCTVLLIKTNKKKR